MRFRSDRMRSIAESSRGGAKSQQAWRWLTLWPVWATAKGRLFGVLFRDLESEEIGGYGWTRTTDLSIMSSAGHT